MTALKFPREWTSERILKIGQYVVKLWQKLRGVIFFDSRCGYCWCYCVSLSHDGCQDKDQWKLRIGGGGLANPELPGKWPLKRCVCDCISSSRCQWWTIPVLVQWMHWVELSVRRRLVYSLLRSRHRGRLRATRRARRRFRAGARRSLALTRTPTTRLWSTLLLVIWRRCYKTARCLVFVR